MPHCIVGQDAPGSRGRRTLLNEVALTVWVIRVNVASFAVVVRSNVVRDLVPKSEVAECAALGTDADCVPAK